MILWGMSDMEGVPPAPHSVTFAPHRVALAPRFVHCASLFAQCIYDYFHWTVYNITCGDVLNYCRPTKWSEHTLEHLAALSTQEALCYRL